MTDAHKADDPKLSPELKAKWLTALRSGQYKQGRGYLCTDNLYCCLGVLQAITELPKHEDGELLDYMEAAEIGLSVDLQSELSTMNDDGKPFTEIADYIEANL